MRVSVLLQWVIAAALDNKALRDAITVPSRLIYERLITPSGAFLSGKGFLENVTEGDAMLHKQRNEERSRRWI